VRWQEILADQCPPEDYATLLVRIQVPLGPNGEKDPNDWARSYPGALRGFIEAELKARTDGHTYRPFQHGQ
jgi:hypothetical protein